MSDQLPQDEEFEPFFAAIGRLTVSWAHMEFLLDMTISAIHQRLNGHTVEPEVPIHLSRKVKYLKRCINRLESLKRYQTAVLPLLQQVSDGVEFRKNMVHGVALNHPAGAAEAEITRFMHSKDGNHGEKRISVKPEDILKASQDTDKLTHQFFEFAKDLIDRL